MDLFHSVARAAYNKYFQVNQACRLTSFVVVHFPDRVSLAPGEISIKQILYEWHHRTVKKAPPTL